MVTITQEQYQMTPEELKGGQAGQDTYNKRIATLRGESTPSDTPTNLTGTLPSSSGGGILGLQNALRTALDEAAKNNVTSRMEAQSGVLGEGTAPSVFKAALGLAQSGIEQSRTSIANDVLRIYQDQAKQIEFNPDQFRSTQGGVYDLKNNKWIINPSNTSDSGGGSTKSLTRTDVQQLGLPISLVGTSWNMLQQQLDSDIPPNWFKNMIEEKARINFIPEKLNSLWVEFRNNFNNTFSSSASNSDQSLSFEDF